MGLLDKMLKRDNPQSTSETITSKPQSRNQDEWRYRAEPCDKHSIITVLNVEDAVNAYGCQYFQNELKKYSADTIDVWLVDPKGVKRCAVEWNFKKPKKERETYIVDSNGTMLGYLNYLNIDKTGYKLGDKARAAITKPPAGGSEYCIHILKKKS